MALIKTSSQRPRRRDAMRSKKYASNLLSDQSDLCQNPATIWRPGSLLHNRIYDRILGRLWGRHKDDWQPNAKSPSCRFDLGLDSWTPISFADNAHNKVEHQSCGGAHGAEI